MKFLLVKDVVAAANYFPNQEDKKGNPFIAFLKHFKTLLDLGLRDEEYKRSRMSVNIFLLVDNLQFSIAAKC